MLRKYIVFQKDFGDELKVIAKNKVLWEMGLWVEMYSVRPHWVGVTCINLEKKIEISFDFWKRGNLFKVDLWKFHLFTDSYLHYYGRWSFAKDKQKREREYEDCQDYLLSKSLLIKKEGKYFTDSNRYK